MPPERAKPFFDKIRDALANGTAADIEVPLEELTAPEELPEMHSAPEIEREKEPKVVRMAEGLSLKKKPLLDHRREWEQEHE
ncbi:MAG: hypothetical protein UY50_C0011G0005 [Parcubacteria group bacterium GW2011_GWA2_49_9]|nr:MAG: hypothetical protein UY50_C0011G0005 [Parcubacteria group bacterium GW2011_GWA2_49_9]